MRLFKIVYSEALPASVKRNGLENREEGDGVINRYLAKSERKPIPGHMASNRKVLLRVKSNAIYVLETKQMTHSIFSYLAEEV